MKSFLFSGGRVVSPRRLRGHKTHTPCDRHLDGDADGSNESQRSLRHSNSACHAGGIANRFTERELRLDARLLAVDRNQLHLGPWQLDR